MLDSPWYRPPPFLTTGSDERECMNWQLRSKPGAALSVVPCVLHADCYAQHHRDCHGTVRNMLIELRTPLTSTAAHPPTRQSIGPIACLYSNGKGTRAANARPSRDHRERPPNDAAAAPVLPLSGPGTLQDGGCPTRLLPSASSATPAHRFGSPAEPPTASEGVHPGCPHGVSAATCSVSRQDGTVYSGLKPRPTTLHTPNDVAECRPVFTATIERRLRSPKAARCTAQRHGQYTASPHIRRRPPVHDHDPAHDRTRQP